ncbi:hypothetical protein ACFVW2_41895, partial [Streptomyces sp. NPDC058171]
MSVGFERYCGDAGAIAASERQAEFVRDAIGRRPQQFGLNLRADKTRIVYSIRRVGTGPGVS